ncbi:MoxR family ATPase [Acidaminococcus intestini]|nr:MoxR family ATPase [Acidaminococcus intestini]
MKQFQGSDTYIASPELVRSVNIAAALQKPLLIKGEPGTGKTMLAQSIADSLGMKLFIWNIKSTTKAQDGLYVYDTVQRLYDSQFGAEGVDDIKNTSIWASWARLLAKISRASFSLMKSIRRTWNFPMTSCGNWTAWNFTFPKRGDGPHQKEAHCHHYVQCGKGTAGCFPAPLHLPLHCLPRSGHDAPDHSCP